MSTAEPAAAEVSVFDASALLAWLRKEPGADLVETRLTTGVISAANWSETWQKLHQHGVDADLATRRLGILGLRVEPLTATDAIAAARLWPPPDTPASHSATAAVWRSLNDSTSRR